jgi:hypothetical protein
MKRRIYLAAIGAVLFPLAAFAQEQEQPSPLLPPHDIILPTFWDQHGWQIVAAAAAVVVLLILVVLWLCRARPAAVQPPVVVARRALAKLQGRAEDGSLATGVSQILKRYVLAVLQLPSDELTTAEFRTVLSARPELSAELTREIGDFLRRCDEWKFENLPPVGHLNAVARALELVNKTNAALAAFAAQPALREQPVASS